MALTIDGQVVVWGGSSTAPLNAVTNSFAKSINDTVAVSAGAFHNPGLADGRVFLWQFDHHALTPTLFTNIVAVAAATNFNLALRADGRLFSWGTGRHQRGGHRDQRHLPLPPVAYAIAGAMERRDYSVGGLSPDLVGRRYVAIVCPRRWIEQLGGELVLNGALATTVTIKAKAAATNALERECDFVSSGGDKLIRAVTDALAQVSARMLNIWGDNFSGQQEIPTGLMTLLAVAAGAFTISPCRQMEQWWRGARTPTAKQMCRRVRRTSSPRRVEVITVWR